MPDSLLTASKPELLDKDSDRTLRGVLYDFFAFGRSLEAARAKFASYVDLSPTQYLIMIALKNSTLDEPMGINQIAARLHLSGAFVTTVTSKLQTLGLAEKKPDSVDRRRISLAITEKGRALLKKLAPYQREINDVEFGSLTREDFQNMSRILEELIASSDKAFALQRYKSSIKDSTKVA